MSRSQFRNRYFPNSYGKLLFVPFTGMTAHEALTQIGNEMSGRISIVTDSSYIGAANLGRLNFRRQDDGVLVLAPKPAGFVPIYVAQLESADAIAHKLYLTADANGIIISSVGALFVASKTYTFSYTTVNFADFIDEADPS